MKRHLCILPLLLLFSLKGYNQSPPEAINYSSVIRGNSGQALPNKVVAFRFSILVGSSSGTVVYQETQTKTTDQWGAVSLAIGLGSITQGSFAAIDWSAGEHYLKIDLDDNGGSNFQTMGTIQFLSVPYALHSKTAETVINFSESDPIFNNSLAKGITDVDTTRWNSIASSHWGYLNSNLYYNSGNVGIGTSSPASPLSLEITSVNNSPNRALLSLKNNSTDGGSLSSIKLTSGNSGSQTSLTHSSSTYAGVPNTADYGSIVTTGAGFFLHAGGTGNLRFMTNGDGIQGFERMRITNNGKVGIGTLTPRSLLDVVSSEGGSQYSMNASNTNAQGQAGAAFWNNNGGWLKVALLGDQVVDGTAFGQSGESTTQILSQYGAKDMLVGTLNNQSLVLGTNNQPRLTVTNNGQIAINTSTPIDANANLTVRANDTYAAAGIAMELNNDIAQIQFAPRLYNQPTLIFGYPAQLGVTNHFNWRVGGVNIMNLTGQGNLGLNTDDPRSKIHVSDGDVYIDNPSNGIILKSPDGQCWRITIDNSGNFVKNSIACP